MRTWLTWLIVLGFGVAVVATDWIHRLVVPAPEPEVTRDGQPDSVLEDYRITLHAEDGRPRYHLTGPRLSHYPEDDSNLLEQPHLTVFAAADDPAWTVAAERGRLSSGAEELLLEGEVTLTRLPGPDRPPLRIDTRDLRVEPHRDRAETDQAVRVTGERYVVDAVGARATLHDSGPLVELFSQVRGRHEPIER